MASAAVQAEAVVPLLFIHCLLLLHFCRSFVFGPCIAVQYFVTFLVLQSFRQGRESWVSDLHCLFDVILLILFFASSSQRCGLVCGVFRGIFWPYSLAL